MRSTLGIAVFSGMLGVTLFGIFLTPVFYYLVVRLFGQPASPAPVELSKHPAADARPDVVEGLVLAGPAGFAPSGAPPN
jgi:hypothetical protein